MSRTRRIYNKLRLKKTPRYNLDDGVLDVVRGIPFTKSSWICMGRCPQCRDPNLEPKLVRKRLKELVREDVKEEIG